MPMAARARDGRTIQKTYMDCERSYRLCRARSGSPQLVINALPTHAPLLIYSTVEKAQLKVVTLASIAVPRNFSFTGDYPAV